MSVSDSLVKLWCNSQFKTHSVIKKAITKLIVKLTLPPWATVTLNNASNMETWTLNEDVEVFTLNVWDI